MYIFSYFIQKNFRNKSFIKKKIKNKKFYLCISILFALVSHRYIFRTPQLSAIFLLFSFFTKFDKECKQTSGSSQNISEERINIFHRCHCMRFNLEIFIQYSIPHYISFAWLVHRLIDPGISCSAVRRVQLQSSQSLRQEVVQTTKTTGKFISLESCSFLLFLSSKREQLPCSSSVSNLCYRCLPIFSTDSRKLPFFSAISYKTETKRKEINQTLRDCCNKTILFSTI